jgi:hypothetical protein
MALSTAAEEAFHAAIEAAYTMENMVKLWGRESKQALAAYDSYEAHMQRYYDLTRNPRERFWNKRCAKEPWSAGCRCYDC